MIRARLPLLVALFGVVALLAPGALRTQSPSSDSTTITCEGTYGGHLQGVATDGEAIYWSHTVQLAKTDLAGKLSLRVDVPSHHGDLTLHDGKLYVSVELGEFNQPAGRSDPWVWIYDTERLELVSKRRVPELVHGCGGIARGDGRFILVGGLPEPDTRNYLFEYDDELRFRARHVLPSGHTHLGIQTAAWIDGRWWLGCYGSPKNPGLLVADRGLRLAGRAPTDLSYGVASLPDGRVLRGEVFASGRRGRVEVLPAPPTASRVVTVVALGDSITRGIRAGVEWRQTFSSRLEEALRARGHDADVINLGIGGERTDQALRRLGAVTEQRPAICLVMYGTNDSWIDAGKRSNRLSLHAYRRNLGQLVSELRRHRITPILMTEPRFAPNARRNGLDEDPNGELERYVEACRQVAREKDVPLVDHFLEWTRAEAAGENLSEWTTDGCHPDPRGHERMAEAIAPVALETIGALLARDASPPEREPTDDRPSDGR